MTTKKETGKAPEMYIPVLSNEQKLKVLLVERDVVSTNSAHQAALTRMNAVIAELVKELGIDPTLFTLDMNGLVLIPVK